MRAPRSSPDGWRRLFLLTLVSGLFPWIAGCAESRAAAPPKRPNVVLIVVDTLRADVVLEQRSVRTPSLLALARDGVVFPDAYSHAPMTLPSHVSLLSSRLPFETGVMVNGVPVPTDLPLLPERLGASGYRSAATVSLGTLGGKPGRGLDRAFGAYEAKRGVVQAPEIYAELERQLAGLEDEQPFFLFAHYSDPHEPYNAHGTVEHVAEILVDGEVVDTVTTSDMTTWERALDLAPGAHEVTVRSEDPFNLRSFECRGPDVAFEWDSEHALEGALERRSVIRNSADETRRATVRIWLNDDVPVEERVRRYMLEVEFADRYVGLLLDALRARGLYDDAVIAFTSDHGEALGDHGMFAHVQSLYDELIHVPLILKPAAGDDRRIALEAVRHRLVSHVDLAPTLLDLAGVPPLHGQRGRSLLAERETPAVHVAQTHRPQARRDLICARDERYKMILDADSGTFEMYDLAADPDEREDVFEARAAERPDWPDLLRAIATAAADGDVEVDEDTRAALEAMGYVGEDEE